MLIIDKMIVGGVRFVLDKLSVAVDRELNDDTALREQLLAAQMQVELGEMTQEQFNALEDEVLARIREIRERTGRGGGPIEMGGGGGEGAEGDQGSLGASDIASIDASFVADDYYGEAPAADAVVEAPPASAPAPGPAARKKRRTARKASARPKTRKKATRRRAK